MPSDSVVRRYGAAVICVVVAVAIRRALNPIWGAYSPYMLFTLAVMVSARYWGRGPGYLATALSAFSAIWFIIRPQHWLRILNPDDTTGLVVFLIISVLITHLAGDLREAYIAAARAERGLRQQTRLADLSHDAIITMDDDRRVIGWNAGAEELYGWTAAEAMGKVTHQLLRTSGPVSCSELDAILRREGRWEGELTETARDGRQVRVESRQILVHGDGNRPVGIQEINRDITERSRTQEALRESEERLRLAVDAAQIGIFEHWLETNRLVCDERTIALWGPPPPPDAADTEIPLHVHPDDRARAEQAAAAARDPSSEGILSSEYRLVQPDGSIRWVATRGRVYFEGEGQDRHAVRIVGVHLDLTAQKRAEAALRESEQRYRAVVEQASDAFFLHDRQGRFIDVNQQACESLGYPREELLTKSVIDIDCIYDFDAARRIWAQLQEDAPPLTIYGFQRRKDGTSFPVEVRLGACTVAGRPLILALARDITERRRIEQALRESEERFRVVQELSPDGFAILRPLRDADGRVSDFIWIYENEANARLTRTDASTAIGQRLHDTMPGIRDGEFFAAFRQTAETGEPSILEAKARPSLLPATPWFRIVVVRLGTDIAVLAQDITNRKLAEEALRHSEEQYRALFEAMQEAFAVGDVICDAAGKPVDWRYVEVNPAFETMFGVKREEVTGRTYREMFPDYEWEYWVRTLGQVALTGKPAHLGQYGRERQQYFEAIAYSPRPDRFAAVFSDVTARKENEERLRHAQKLESIGVLAGGVAHDFNNLLTVIIGNASTALEEYPSCEPVKAILDAADRAAHLTTQLLAYAGKGQFVVKVLSLNDAISQSRPLLSASIPKRVSLSFRLTSGMPPVEQDPNRLEQILTNLVINAFEAIPTQAEGRIEVATGATQITAESARRRSRDEIAPGAYVWLEVRDNGMGMDEETVSRIFDPFFSTKFPGRGLGLAAVQGIVRSSGGFIEVESRPGEGSVFRVFLRASPKQPEPTAKKA